MRPQFYKMAENLVKYTQYQIKDLNPKFIYILCDKPMNPFYCYVASFLDKYEWSQGGNTSRKV